MKRTALLTLKTPLHHGGEINGVKPMELPSGVGNNYTPHRKLPMTIKQSDQEVIVDLPIVSGNSIRHKLRESLVDPTLNQLGLTRKDVNKDLLEMFVSGGGMSKISADKNEQEEEKQENKKNKKNALEPSVPLLVRDRETLRSTFPMLSLFGASYGNRMLNGLVNVGIAFPVFRENAHLFKHDSNMSLSTNITSYQMGTRMDKNAVESGEESQQSIYYYEVVAQGVKLEHEFTLGSVSTVELSAMQLAIERFKDNPFLGGKHNVGLGEIMTDNWYEDLGVSSDIYLDWVQKNKDTILEYMDIWNKPEEIVVLDDKGKEKLEWNEDLAKRLDDLIKEREQDIQNRGV